MSNLWNQEYSRRAFMKWAATAGLASIAGSGLIYHTLQKKFVLPSAAADLPPIVAAAAANSVIREENQLPGDANWRIVKPARGDIQGYASATSVAPGDELFLHVSTAGKAAGYRVDIYRLGYYQGLGARHMWSKTDLTGKDQGWWSRADGRTDLPQPEVETKYLDAGWEPSVSIRIPDEWVTGYYLVKLTMDSGPQSYIPFIVRDDRFAHAIMAQASVTTWHAYSAWGGYGYYGHYDELSRKYLTFNESPRNNAVTISFNRPYEQGQGTGDMFLEYPSVYWLESMGYDVGYVTNIDTHLGRPNWKPKAFLSLGHDEYYSRDMKTRVRLLLENGTNLGFLGANDMYWQVRFERDRAGSWSEEPRTMICYKYRVRQDPVKDQCQRTGMWREQGDPENRIIGQMYSSVVYDFPDWVVSNPNHWLFEGFGLEPGFKVPRLIGWEYDRVFGGVNTPAGVEKIAVSPLINEKGEPDEAHSTIYRHWSGGHVFGAGTIYWGFGLSNPMSDPRGSVSPVVQGVTANLLNRYLA